MLREGDLDQAPPSVLAAAALGRRRLSMPNPDLGHRVSAAGPVFGLASSPNRGPGPTGDMRRDGRSNGGWQTRRGISDGLRGDTLFACLVEVLAALRAGPTRRRAGGNRGRSPRRRRLPNPSGRSGALLAGAAPGGKRHAHRRVCDDLRRQYSPRSGRTSSPAPWPRTAQTSIVLSSGTPTRNGSPNKSAEPHDATTH